MNLQNIRLTARAVFPNDDKVLVFFIILNRKEFQKV